MTGEGSGISRIPGGFEDTRSVDLNPTLLPRSLPNQSIGGEVRLQARMAEVVTSSGSSLHLPSSMKLKGEENYAVWKEAMLNLAISNGLKRYLRKDPRKPIQVDEDDTKASDEAVRAWQDWEAGDAKTKLALSYNLSSILIQVI